VTALLSLIGGAVAAVVAAALVGTGSAASGERLLVVAAAPPSYREVGLVYDGSGHLIRTVRTPTRGPYAMLTWSANGSMVAIADQAGVWVERSDGNRRRQLLGTNTSCSTTCVGTPSVAWTPDGTHLAVGGIDPATTGLDLINVKTGTRRQLRTPRPYVFYTPIGYSPDGRWLALAIARGNGGTASCCSEALAVARADGTHLQVLFRFADAIHDGPGAATWSPSSSRIAFTDDGRATEDPRLAIVDVPSGTVHRLDPRNAYDQSPAWSPDGKRLALADSQSSFTEATDGSGLQPLGIPGTHTLWLHNNDLLLATGTTGHQIDLFAQGQGTARLFVGLPGRDQLLSFEEAH
jgi:Tol biopolymer transport system component